MASTTINSTSENPASRPESTMAAECRQPRAATSRARSAFEAMRERKKDTAGAGPPAPNYLWMGVPLAMSSMATSASSRGPGR
jgi:hypothetical protein